ncbi:MAG: glycosyltransferase family 9 protein [Armatimonadetes bacterium]|nr:glycosyltransferase family 9 protein [Armatimonadota bacterium]
MKALIVKLNAIGDVVFATPLVAGLAEAYPGLDIDWLVGRHAAPILAGHPLLRRTILYDGPWAGSRLAGALETLRILPALRRERYDLAFCLHRSRAATLLTSLSGARRRIGFEHGGAERWLTEAVPFDAAAHETRRYLALLAALGHDAGDRPMCLGWTAEAAGEAADLLPDGPWVGLAPGGGRNPGTEMLIKRWPAERFAELARRVEAELGARVAVFGTPDEADLCAEVAGATGLNLCGRTRLAGLAAVLARLSVFVANDSGPLHMAAAAGTPTIALFGPTDPRLVAPLGEPHRHFWRPPDCAPCYRPDNARDHAVWHCARVGDELRCLRDVSVADVYGAVRGTRRGDPPWSPSTG